MRIPASRYMSLPRLSVSRLPNPKYHYKGYTRCLSSFPIGQNVQVHDLAKADMDKVETANAMATTVRTSLNFFTLIPPFFTIELK